MAYTKKLTRTTSATTTNVWGTGAHLSSEAKVSIPFVAEDGLKVTLDFTFNHTSTNTNTVAVEDNYNFPSQNIKIPGKHTYELVAIIEQQHMKSNVYLDYTINFSRIFYAESIPALNLHARFDSDNLASYIKDYDPDAMTNYPAFLYHEKENNWSYTNIGTIEVYDTAQSLETLLIPKPLFY